MKCLEILEIFQILLENLLNCFCVDIVHFSDIPIMSGIGVFRVTCLVLHVLLTQKGVDSYSTGSPTSACGDMTPCSLMTYGVGPQTLSSSPYTVQPTVTCFHAWTNRLQ